MSKQTKTPAATNNAPPAVVDCASPRSPPLDLSGTNTESSVITPAMEQLSDYHESPVGKKKSRWALTHRSGMFFAELSQPGVDVFENIPKDLMDAVVYDFWATLYCLSFPYDSFDQVCKDAFRGWELGMPFFIVKYYDPLPGTRPTKLEWKSDKRSVEIKKWFDELKSIVPRNMRAILFAIENDTKNANADKLVDMLTFISVMFHIQADTFCIEMIMVRVSKLIDSEQERFLDLFVKLIEKSVRNEIYSPKSLRVMVVNFPNKYVLFKAVYDACSKFVGTSVTNSEFLNHPYFKKLFGGAESLPTDFLLDFYCRSQKVRPATLRTVVELSSDSSDGDADMPSSQSSSSSNSDTGDRDHDDAHRIYKRVRVDDTKPKGTSEGGPSCTLSPGEILYCGVTYEYVGHQIRPYPKVGLGVHNFVVAAKTRWAALVRIAIEHKCNIRVVKCGRNCRTIHVLINGPEMIGAVASPILNGFIYTVRSYQGFRPVGRKGAPNGGYCGPTAFSQFGEHMEEFRTETPVSYENEEEIHNVYDELKKCPEITFSEWTSEKAICF